jgi:hypothetical protein
MTSKEISIHTGDKLLCFFSGNLYNLAVTDNIKSAHLK